MLNKFLIKLFTNSLGKKLGDNEPQLNESMIKGYFGEDDTNSYSKKKSIALRNMLSLGIDFGEVYDITVDQTSVEINLQKQKKEIENVVADSVLIKKGYMKKKKYSKYALTK